MRFVSNAAEKVPTDVAFHRHLLGREPGRTAESHLRCGLAHNENEKVVEKGHLARHLLMWKMSYTVQSLRQNVWRRFGICAPSEGETETRGICTPLEVGTRISTTPSERVDEQRENATPSEGVGRDRRDGIAAVGAVR